MSVRSDFDESFFSTQELEKFNSLLVRLRHFECAVSREFRALQRNLRTAETTITNLTNRLTALGQVNNQQIGGNGPVSIEENNDDNVEVMMLNPFQSLAGSLEKFDGNPQVNFSNWCEQFLDQLGLFDNLNETQKLHRLKIALSGVARKEMEKIPDPPAPNQKTLNYVLTSLKLKFPSRTNIVIAKQKLADCRQAPGEAVHAFANRLCDFVNGAMSGKDDVTVEERLLDEFMDRLSPELGEYVKSIEPTTYGQAFEAAIKKEMWTKAKIVHQSGESSNTAAAIESLTRRLDEVMVLVSKQNAKKEVLEINNSSRRPAEKCCFYCKKPGHFIEECRKRKWANKQNNGGERRERREGKHRGNRRNRDYSRDRSERHHSRSESREHRHHQRDSRDNGYRNNSPSPSHQRVRFREKKSCNIIRATSPFLLALCMLAFPACVSAYSQPAPTVENPMICLPNSPTTLWRLPNHPICPHSAWPSSEVPIDHQMKIFRPNTIEYRTKATLCRCTRSMIKRYVGIIGGHEEEVVQIHPIDLSADSCTHMKDTKISSAGVLLQKNGFLGTNNSLEVGWASWPFGIGTTLTPVDNCFVQPTVVYTRFGTNEISMPLGSTSACQYKDGSCHSDQGQLIWTPDMTQSCKYIHLKNWDGSYSNKIWISSAQDFALSFINITLIDDCRVVFAVSDQGFAVPLSSLNDAQSKANRAMDNLDDIQRREKRSTAHSTIDTVPSAGIVYSTELAARLTAIAKGLQQTTVQLFDSALRHVCSSLQAVADATMTLASANPTLLARTMLNATFIEAKLVTADLLEVSPCISIPANDVHYRRLNAKCYDQLPVTFRGVAGSFHNGFLHPATSILSSRANHMPCSTHRFVYLPAAGGTLRQFDQETGNIKFVPATEIHRLERFGRIDFPEIPLTIFRNQILANFSELFPHNLFHEYIEGNDINHHIHMLVTTPSDHPTSDQQQEHLSSLIVARGLFSFLKGGVFSTFQLWVFICCVYTSWTIIREMIIPPQVSMMLNRANIGLMLFNRLLTDRTNKQQNPSAPSISLKQRYPSAENVFVADRQQHETGFKACFSGKINQKPAMILVDTGANGISVCDRRTASTYNFGRLQSAQVPGIKGIENSGGIQTIGFTDVEIELNGAATVVRVHVVDHYGERGFDLVLGTNAFAINPQNDGSISIRLKNAQLLLPDQTTHKANCLTFDLDCTDASASEIQQLKHLLLKNTDVFAKNNFDLGTCSFIAPTIKTSTEIPFTARPFRTPIRHREELKKQIENMIKAGVLVDSTTPWTSNVVLVQKKDGTVRTCVDFRPLNNITETDPFPFPRIDELLNKVAGHHWYSALDLANGFWQIRLDEASSTKCGIITEFGVYQMKRLPFGLKNAPAAFMRMMLTVLKDLPYAICYMDDVLVFTNGSISDHLCALSTVFKRIRSAGLKLKAEKCLFGQRSINFLGHLLTNKGYEPGQRHIDPILSFPEPTTVKEMRRFLGLTSFFRKFIPAFSTITAPLNALLKKNNSFVWGQDQQNAFEQLKQKLTSKPVLISPDFDLPFHLFTDASDVAYGAALLQSPNGKDLQAVAFASRSLNGAEKRYFATHAELGAIVWALGHFRPLIFRADVTIHTDHRPLTYLFAKASTNAKLNRWLLLIQDIEPRIAYVEGSSNQIADALSRVRMPWINAKSDLTAKRDDLPYLLAAEPIDEPVQATGGSLKDATANDPTLQWALQQMRLGWPANEAEIEGAEKKKFYTLRERLSAENGVVQLEGRLVIPAILRAKLLEILHRSHLGMSKMKGRARPLMYWPCINREIENMARNCDICTAVAPAPPKQHFAWPPAVLAWERIHIDFCGPIFDEYWLIIIDAYSKFAFAFPMTTTTSAKTIDVLDELFSVFGAPMVLVSDNGPQLTSELFNNFLRQQNVRHITTAPYSPQSNGFAENFVRTFKTALKKMTTDGASKTVIHAAARTILQDYRSAPHATTGHSPSSLFLKRDIRTVLEALLWDNNVYDPARQKQQAENQYHRPRPSQFQIGDKVWWRKQKGQIWAPGHVIKQLGQAMFRIGVEGTDDQHSDLHVNQLKSRRTSARRQNNSLEQNSIGGEKRQN